MDRFYVPSLPDSGRIELSGTEAHHLRDVKRLRVGDPLVLFDGSGVEYVARLEKATHNQVLLDIVEKKIVSRELASRITLAIAPPRGDKMNIIVRKCAELGASRLVPTVTEFTVLKPGPRRIERWRRTAIEASKQSGRNLITDITDPMPFADALALRSQHDIAIMPDLSDDAMPIQQALQDAQASAAQAAESAICLIGPEGGFSENERQLARSAGFRPVRLVPSILTTEAAAFATLAMLAYALR